MKTSFGLLLLLLITFSASGQRVGSKAPTKTVAERPKVATLLPKPVSRTVEYRSNDLVNVRTRLRYSTVLILPDEEPVVEVSCGDREFWVIDVFKNLVHIKPSKEAAATNLNVTTAKGNLYSFILVELSGVAEGPDVRVVIELKDAAMRARAGIGEKLIAPALPPKYEAELRSYREQLSVAEKKASDLSKKLAATNQELDVYPGKLIFDYAFQSLRSPFEIESIFHDGKFTYIRAKAYDGAAVYEVVGGTPSLLDFTYSGGLYVIRKVVERGYLMRGKSRATFTRVRR